MTTLQHTPLPDRMALPPSERRWFDPDHTRVEFVARYIKVTNVRGRFRSDRVQQRGHEAMVSGRLQLAGVTRPVELEVDYLATNEDPWGRTTAQFFGAGALNRSDWGITGNVALPGCGYAVGESTRPEVDVQLVAEPPSTVPPLPVVRAVEPESWPYQEGRA